MSYPRKKLSENRRGVILILTLWISIILAVMAFSVAYELRINMGLARQSQDQLRARALARAGLAKAVVDLRNDRILAIADPTFWHSDAQEDVWALEDDKTDIELGGGTYTVEITDEESKINLVVMNQQNVHVLAYLLESIGEFDEEIAINIAHMIVDWQDPDGNISVAGVGKEIPFWTDYCIKNFEEELPENWFFRPKNDFFFSLDELLEIPGITKTLIYGEPEPLDPKKRRRKRRREDEHSSKLEDYVTVRSSSFLNVLTIPQLVAEGLFRAALPLGSLEYEDYAQKLIEYREERLSGIGEGSTTVLNATQHLDQAGIPTDITRQANQIFRLQIISNFFTIRSIGVFNGISDTLQVRVRLNVEPYPFDPSRLETYGSRDPQSRASVLNKGSSILDPEVRVEEIIDL